jgi:rhodanese-related sulfurtransferase
MKRLSKFTLLAMFLLFAPLATQAAEGQLKITDMIVGVGDEALEMTKVSVHYSGWLMDGTAFDSSVGKKPFSFTLGGGEVIAGWDQGVKGMRVGGKRELIIPAHLAYGERGAGGMIPPGATLRFEVELLAVAAPPFSNIDNQQLKELLAQGTRIIDVRRPEEWQQTGVIKGSLLMESFQKTGRLRKGFLDEFTQSVKKDEPIILICRTGSRTGMLANGLSQRFGFTNIYNVTNGIESWIKADNPVIKP